MSKVCDFCGCEINKPNKGFRSSQTGYRICSSCINIIYKTLNDELPQKTNPKMKTPSRVIEPKKLKEKLDERIIGQEDAKISIAIAVYNHYKRLHMKSNVKLEKSNILLIGPTGCGKTLIARTIAELLEVPFIVADCTTLTETGYVGDDVESILTKLLIAADGNLENAQKGIVFLDEVDKLAKVPTSGGTKDPSGEGVQQALLKLIEGAKINIPASLGTGRKMPSEKTIEFDTKNVLFICGGAFAGIESIINKRTSKKSTSIGFGANVEKEKDKTISEAFKLVAPEDIIEYGLIPEFIGRIPVIAPLEELNADALVDIMVKPKDCIVDQYKEFFRYDGVELEFTEDSLQEIANKAIKQKTGARGLRGIIESVLKDSMYNIPSEENVKKCIVEKDFNVTVIREEAKKELVC